ncbi:PHB depolymerase family esterase, partial [Serpentinicella sp. ANB-PHB4]|uniref:alpha/beta hydrolase family esterase n=1 Tax=Serpentinicella sp. ANB-PHB4 TaxID=3074076 RepID=UPI00285EBA30
MKIRNSRQLCLILVLALVISLLPLASFANTSGGSFTNVSFSGRTYKLFVPNSYQSGTDVPLMVMLHGCTQDADQFAAGTRMNDLAAVENFIVMYP